MDRVRRYERRGHWFKSSYPHVMVEGTCSLYNQHMTQDELHDALDALVTTEKRPLVRIVGHALIALRLLTKLECAYEDCVLPSREFSAHDGTKRYDKAGPTVDHVIELWNGGTDRPENLRLVHFSCNASKSTKMRMMKNFKYRDEMREVMLKRWQDPEFRVRVADTIGRPKTSEEKSKIAQRVAALPRTPCSRCGKMFQPAGHGSHRKTCTGDGM